MKTYIKRDGLFWVLDQFGREQLSFKHEASARMYCQLENAK